MAQARKVLQRITTIRSMRRITQAMKMIAIAKLEQRKRQSELLVPYATAMEALFQRMQSHLPPAERAQYGAGRPLRKSLWVVITSDRGLCGTFNHATLRGLPKAYQSAQASGESMHYLPIGQKGLEFLRRQELPYTAAYVDCGKHVQWGQAIVLRDFLVQAFIQGDCDRVMVCYQPQGYTAASVAVPYLPVAFPRRDETHAEEAWIHEPDGALIARHILPQWLALQLYQHLLKAQVAEQKARMFAMSQATDNADELLDALRLKYNRLRQTMITKGIMEISTGA